MKAFKSRSRTWNNDTYEPTDPVQFAIDSHRSSLFRKIELEEPNVLTGFLTPEKWRSLKPRQKTDGRGEGQDPNGEKYLRRTPGQSFRLSIAEMHRMRLRKLQGKLVKHAAQLQFQGTEPDTWETDLQDYSMSLFSSDSPLDCANLLSVKSKRFKTTTT